MTSMVNSFVGLGRAHKYSAGQKRYDLAEAGRNARGGSNKACGGHIFRHAIAQIPGDGQRDLEVAVDHLDQSDVLYVNFADAGRIGNGMASLFLHIQRHLNPPNDCSSCAQGHNALRGTFQASNRALTGAGKNNGDAWNNHGTLRFECVFQWSFGTCGGLPLLSATAIAPIKLIAASAEQRNSATDFPPPLNSAMSSEPSLALVAFDEKKVTGSSFTALCLRLSAFVGVRLSCRYKNRFRVRRRENPLSVWLTKWTVTKMSDGSLISATNSYRKMPGFRAITERHNVAIHAAVGLAWPMTTEVAQKVKMIDLTLFVTEWRDLMTGFVHPNWAPYSGIQPLSRKIEPWDWKTAKHQYLVRHRRYFPEAAQ